jgi:hypothetical protein
MHTQEGNKRKICVSVGLSASQKSDLTELCRKWGIGKSTIIRALINYVMRKILIDPNFTLDNLTSKYRQTRKTTDLGKKNCKTTVWLSVKEYQTVNDVAEQCFYQPSELIGILMKLLISNTIPANELWD